MANPPLTEKLVYQTLRGIFVGNDSQVRQLKPICQVISKHHQTNVKIREFTLKYDINEVSKIAKVLLENKIFGSEAKAKLRFPELFEISSGQANQPTTSEPKVATSCTTAVQRVGVYSPEELLNIGDTLKQEKKEEKTETGPADSPTEPFDSICLPLWDQHRLLTRIQYALEKACFTFAQRSLGGVLQREGWDCAEAVELNRWPKVLLTYQEELHLDNVRDIAKPLPTLLDSITQLRHDAVHRTRLSSNVLLQRMTDARLLARLLQDEECSKLMSTIRQKTQEAIERLVRNKQLLDCKLAEIKKEFAAKRTELERQEIVLLEATAREHGEPVVSVSRSLDMLAGERGGSGEIHAGSRYVHDADLSDDDSSGSEGTVEEEERKAEEERKKMVKEEKKKAKKEKKAAKEQAKQQEEANKMATEEKESTAEPGMGQETGDGVAKAVDGDTEMLNQLLPLLAPPADSVSIGSALTDEKNEAEKERHENLLEVEQFFECPEVVPDDHESDPKHPSKDPPLNDEVVATDTMTLINEDEEKPEIAALINLGDSNGQEHYEEPLREPSTNPASTSEGKTGEDADPEHCKSPTRDVAFFGSGHIDLEARSEQSTATKGRSYPLTIIQSYQEESWPGSGGLPVKWVD
ncbi:uncharacterized protein ALTATR162_LOCUS4361 [Alternaria atra]|uniref:Uncharacterized protein n=1 Tax=Alternaria atra TaxID=119953 RepID=A0A8J2N0U9_9PLEO|nr:uncharacterized protein ALTATR162_LOCUS4361 [Alternaria atra]CAG5156564.1 unnamed protein product [Alternaria atra]